MKKKFLVLLITISFIFSSCSNSKDYSTINSETEDTISISINGSSTVDTYLETAQEYIDTGDYSSAISVLEKAMQNYQDDRLNDLLKQAIKLSTDSKTEFPDEIQTTLQTIPTTLSTDDEDTFSYFSLYGEWIDVDYSGTFLDVSMDSNDNMYFELISRQTSTQREASIYVPEVKISDIIDNSYSCFYENEAYGCNFTINFINASEIEVIISNFWYDTNANLSWLPPMDGTYTFKKIDETIPTYIVVSEDTANIRSSASKENNDNIIGSVQKGQKLLVIDYDGYWYKVSYNGETAYISKKMIKSIDDFYLEADTFNNNYDNSIDFSSYEDYQLTDTNQQDNNLFLQSDNEPYDKDDESFNSPEEYWLNKTDMQDYFMDIKYSNLNGDLITSEQKSNDEYIYTVFYEQYIALNSYIGTKKGDLHIPSEIDGLPVKIIGGSFMELHDLKYDKNDIETLYIPSSVLYISGSFSFSGISEVVFEKQNKDDCIIIGEKSFYGCKNLKKISIPENVCYVESAAFGACYSLQEVTIENNKTLFQHGAFVGDINLRTVNLPSKIQINDKMGVPLSTVFFFTPWGEEKFGLPDTSEDSKNTKWNSVYYYPNDYISDDLIYYQSSLIDMWYKASDLKYKIPEKKYKVSFLSFEITDD